VFLLMRLNVYLFLVMGVSFRSVVYSCYECFVVLVMFQVYVGWMGYVCCYLVFNS
jgi:hypothetical protein